MIEVLRYQSQDGRVPLSGWLADLRDPRVRAKLQIRFSRISTGVFGNCKSVGEGVQALREDIGPGYRVYWSRYGPALVILLCGGDKRTQDADIATAKLYWQDWKRRNT